VTLDVVGTGNESRHSGLRNNINSDGEITAMMIESEKETWDSNSELSAQVEKTDSHYFEFGIRN
jgi:hypothetical protein